MWKKLLEVRIWNRIYKERLSEPLLYNFMAIFYLLFGNVIKKIEYDLVPRNPYAFGLNEAFLFASQNKNKLNIERLIICEFGVASGAGLLNLCKISKKLAEYYSIPCEIIGFDTGIGMPDAIDYRDHPEKYRGGDFVPINVERLSQSLPENCKIYYGSIKDTLATFLDNLKQGDKLGFISIDVDYYSSTVESLGVLATKSENKLPKMPIYFDDVNNVDHNEFCGELLAINEFNQHNSKLKISKMNQIRDWRVFKNALYLEQMYWAFDFNSPYFTQAFHDDQKRLVLTNPYI